MCLQQLLPHQRRLLVVLQSNGDLKPLMQRILLQAQPAGLQSNQRGLQLYLPQRPLQRFALWVSCLRYWQRPRLQRMLLIFAAELSYV